MIDDILVAILYFMLYFMLSAILNIIPIIIFRKLLNDRLQGRKWFNFIYLLFIISGIISISILYSAKYELFIIGIFLTIITYYVYRRKTL